MAVDPLSLFKVYIEVDGNRVAEYDTSSLGRMSSHEFNHHRNLFASFIEETPDKEFTIVVVFNPKHKQDGCSLAIEIRHNDKRIVHTVCENLAPTPYVFPFPPSFLGHTNGHQVSPMFKFGNIRDGDNRMALPLGVNGQIVVRIHRIIKFKEIIHQNHEFKVKNQETSNSTNTEVWPMYIIWEKARQSSKDEEQPHSMTLGQSGMANPHEATPFPRRIITPPSLVHVLSTEVPANYWDFSYNNPGPNITGIYGREHPMAAYRISYGPKETLTRHLSTIKHSKTQDSPRSAVDAAPQPISVANQNKIGRFLDNMSHTLQEGPSYLNNFGFNQESNVSEANNASAHWNSNERSHPRCTQCGWLGHTWQRCYQNTLDNRDKKKLAQRRCGLCNEPGHETRKCHLWTGKETPAPRYCRSCGQQGHDSRNCYHNTDKERPAPRCCRGCGQQGHDSRNCYLNTDKNLLSRYCGLCDQPGHDSRTCQLYTDNEKPAPRLCGFCKEPDHDVRRCPDVNDGDKQKHLTGDFEISQPEENNETEENVEPELYTASSFKTGIQPARDDTDGESGLATEEGTPWMPETPYDYTASSITNGKKRERDADNFDENLTNEQGAPNGKSRKVTDFDDNYGATFDMEGFWGVGGIL